MELIYATMLMTTNQLALLKANLNTALLVGQMVEFIDRYTLAQLIQPMQQWHQQVTERYPEHVDHKIQVCSSNPKAVGKDTVIKYRTYRAEAKRLGVPSHVFNCYLLHSLLAISLAQPQAESSVSVES